MNEPRSALERRGFSDYFVMGILVGGALLIRWLFLGCRGVLSGDEMHYAESLHRFLHGRFLDGVSDYWSFFYPMAAVPFGLLARDAEAGLRILSLLSGAATVIPAYLIARRLWGRRAALLAGALVALHPNLLLFSVSAFTESFYGVLVILAAYLFVRALSAGLATGALALAGAALGLAAATRQEASFIAAIFVLMILVGVSARAGAPALATRLRRAAVLVAAFAIAVAPYFALLHAKTGQWTVGSKAAVNLSSPAVWRTDLERERYVYSLNDEGTARRIDEQARESAARVLWRERGAIARSYLPKLGEGARLIPLLFATPFLLVLVPLGIFGKRVPRSLRDGETLLVILALFPFVLYSVFRVELRYLVPYLPVHLLWGAAGCDVIMRWISERVSRRSVVAWGAAAVIVASLVPYDVHKYRSTAAAEPVEWKAIGRWMRDTGRGGSRLLAEPGCSVSYYAGTPEATFIPWTDVPGLLAFARRERFEYLLVDERYIRDKRPQLGALLESPIPGGLEEVRRFDGPGGSVSILFRVAQAS